MRFQIVALLLLLPISVWGAAKNKKQTEDPSGWYRYSYDNKTCTQGKDPSPLDFTELLDQLGTRYKKNEEEKDGKVIRSVISIYTPYGFVSSFFVRGKKECEAELATVKTKLKSDEEAHKNRYK